MQTPPASYCSCWPPSRHNTPSPRPNTQWSQTKLQNKTQKRAKTSSDQPLRTKHQLKLRAHGEPREKRRKGGKVALSCCQKFSINTRLKTAPSRPCRRWPSALVSSCPSRCPSSPRLPASLATPPSSVCCRSSEMGAFPGPTNCARACEK